MVKTVRKVGKKVNFNSKSGTLTSDKEALGIKEKFSKIKKIEIGLKKVQLSSKEGILKKEKEVKQKQNELSRIISLWRELKQINFNELGREELISVLNSQKNFISDLLEHYSISIRKENKYIQKIKKI